MSKRVIEDSEDEEDDDQPESPPQKRTRIVRKPSQRQADISKFKLDVFASHPA